MNLASFGGIHFPASEWERVGLQTHWEHDAVDLHDPLMDTERKLELWASREHAIHDTDPSDDTYDHLAPLPADSPLLTDWNPWTDDDPDRPPVPFDYPTLSVYALPGKNADAYDPFTGGFDRVEFGTVVGVEILSNDALSDRAIVKHDLGMNPHAGRF